MTSSKSLPDAPSAQTQAKKSRTFPHEACSLSALGAVGINLSLVRGAALGHVNPRLPSSFTTPYEAAITHSDSRTFLDKYLYPSLLKQNLRYHSSTSASFMGRATDAASRIFITRDDSGKGRLNTSYFLGVLTSVAIDTAYRPYWARSSSATFNNFGATIGSDAGINLLHEFEPGFRQTVKGHTPKFVSRIEERIARDQDSRRGASTPTR